MRTRTLCGGTSCREDKDVPPCTAELPAFFFLRAYAGGRFARDGRAAEGTGERHLALSPVVFREEAGKGGCRTISLCMDLAK